MDTRFLYASEKLNDAVACLVGAGSVQNRLVLAHRCFAVLKEDDFGDAELAEQFRQIMKRLHERRDGPPDVGIVPFTCSRIRAPKANKIAQAIAELNHLIFLRRIDLERASPHG